MEEVYNNDAFEEDFEESFESEPPKKSKLWIWIAAAAVALAALIAAALLILPKLTGGKSADAEWTLKSGYRVSDRSAAFLALPGGESIKVRGDDIVRAAISADFKRVAVLLSDGTLYVTDQKQQDKWGIADDALSFTLGNDALLYRDKDNRYHKAVFRDREIIDLPKETSYIYTSTIRGKLSIAFEGKNNGLFVLPDGAEEWTKIGSDLVDICGISDDGQVVLWIARKDGKNQLYLTEGEEKFSLGEVTRSPYLRFSKDQKLALIYMIGDDMRVWIKARGKDMQSVKLSGSPYVFTTNAGFFTETNASKIKYIFFAMKNDGKCSLYRVSLDGEKEKFFSKASDIRYADGYVAYKDEDGTLFVAKMGKKELGEATKLAADVKNFSAPGEGKYLYYMRGEALYGYKFGAKEPVKIASDVEGYRISNNGQCVVVMKDKSSDGSYTLSVWKFGDKTPTKFATDATVEYLEDSGKVYYRHVDGKTFDLMYFDGKTSKKIGSDLTE